VSQQITTAFVQQYHDLVERLLQQFNSKFRNAVRVESQQGEQAYWEQIGSVEAEEVFTRYADSPQMDTPHARRMVTLRQWDVGDYIDRFDRVKLLIDPSSTYVQNFVSALARAFDITVIGRNTIGDAATLAGTGGFFNTSYTGKTGTTTVAFPSANKVAVDFGHSGVNANMSIAKLIEARRLLMTFFNDPEVEEWFCGISPSQLASLLKTTEVTSADYNSVKALVRGEIDTFLGLKFIISMYLMNDANPYRLCPVWAKSGMLLSIGKDIVTRVSERSDKRYAWYAYAMASCGSTRMQDNKVIQISCDETVA